MVEVIDLCDSDDDDDAVPSSPVVKKKEQTIVVMDTTPENPSKEEVKEKPHAQRDEMEDIVTMGRGGETWGQRLGVDGRGEPLLPNLPEVSSTGLAALGHLISKGRGIEEPWVKLRCGKEKEDWGSCCLEHMCGSADVSVLQGYIVTTPISDDQTRATDIACDGRKQRGAVAASIARSLTCGDLRKWILGLLGAKWKTGQTKKKMNKETMVDLIKNHAMDPGIGGFFPISKPKPLWDPLGKAIGTLLRLNNDVALLLRRAKRLYSGICDRSNHAASLCAGNGFFRPSWEARFSKIYRSVSETEAPFSTRTAFEQWEISIELRAFQDRALYDHAVVAAHRAFDRRRDIRLNNEGQRDKERMKTAEELKKDRSEGEARAKREAERANNYRPLATFYSTDLDLATALRRTFSSSSSESEDLSAILTAMLPPPPEEDSIHGVIATLVTQLDEVPAVAKYAVIALVCLLGNSNDEQRPFQYVGLDAVSVLVGIAFRGIAGDACANGATLESFAAANEQEDEEDWEEAPEITKKDVASILQWLSTFRQVPPSLRGGIVQRTSILLGSRHAKDSQGRYDMVRRELGDETYSLETKLRLEHDLLQLHRTRKKHELEFDQDAEAIVERAKARKQRVPVETLEGGNPLGKRVGVHSTLVAEDRDDEDVRGFDVGVEQYALDHYAKEGYWGKHSEGALLSPLGRLLLAPAILSTEVPGAFVHPRDIVPRDYGVSQAFARRRSTHIDSILAEITDVAAAVAAAHEKYFGEEPDRFIAASLDAIPLVLLQAIALGLGNGPLKGFLQAYADLGCQRGGLPDLLLLRVSVDEVPVPPETLEDWLVDRDYVPTTKKPKNRLTMANIRSMLACDDDDPSLLPLGSNRPTEEEEDGPLANETGRQPKKKRVSAEEYAAQMQKLEERRNRLRRPIDPRILADPSITFECRLVEVKSYNDSLADIQRVWVDKLLDSAVDVKIAELPLSKQAKAKENKIAREKRAARLSTSSSSSSSPASSAKKQKNRRSSSSSSSSSEA